jgi:hypothetical protein
METTTPIQTPQQSAILQRLGVLEAALLAQDPEMPKHLGEIHRLLITHEELTHLLKDEQIAVIMEAQQLQTNTTLVASVTGTAGKKAAAKKAAGITLGDL